MNILKVIWKKSSILFKMVFIIIILYLLIQLYNITHKKEGFNNNTSISYKNKTGESVYDKFYVSIYDDILHNNSRMKLETNTILKYPSGNGSLLDIGSATGHLVNLLKNHYNCVGIDTSIDMIKRANYNYPDNNYIRENVLESMLFNPNQFTHITCFYFTIYYIKNKQLFFENCNKWLVPKGYLFIHLVDKVNFMSDVDVKSFDVKNHKYSFKYIPKTKDVSIFKETFINNDNNSVRNNEHILHMNSQSEILGYAKKARFDLIEVIDMKKCDFHFQYLYVLQKNN